MKVFLNTKVHLRFSRREPAAAAPGQRFWFRKLFHAEHVAIEAARAVFTAFWYGKLYVINRQKPGWNLHLMFRLWQVRHGAGIFHEFL